jgi:ABC-type branched-subunit amino acid transport system ATPase component
LKPEEAAATVAFVSSACLGGRRLKAKSPDQALLSVRHLGKQFGGLWALRDVELHVEPGQIRGLIGPNGAGKTTLLNIIGGAITPSTGTVDFSGRSIIGRRPHEVAALGIARTFQHLTLFGGMTVLENVMVGLHCRLSGPLSWRRVALNSETAACRAARELLEAFELDKIADDDVNGLSIAQRRRVELARALAVKPIMLLLDEPAAGLSVSDLAGLIATLRFLREQEGMSILLVEHVMDFVMEVCDRLTVLDFGEVLADGTPVEIRRHPRVIEAYLGRPPA